MKPARTRNTNPEVRTLNQERAAYSLWLSPGLDLEIVSETPASLACRSHAMSGTVLRPITVTLVPSGPRSSQYSICSSIVFALFTVARTVSELRSNCPETTPAANTRMSNKPAPTVFIIRLLTLVRASTIALLMGCLKAGVEAECRSRRPGRRQSSRGIPGGFDAEMIRTRGARMVFALILSLSLAAEAITGVVKDPSGGAVSGASVVVRSASGDERQTVTGPDGRFTVDDAPNPGTLIVRAGGFATQEQSISGPGDVEVILSPATLLETVTVTPERREQRLGDIPASVNVLDSTDIRQSPAVVADDVLRQIPTFSLFRRTSNLSSHPTDQGVSLRGIGPSGVSRTLVLLDGVPFNDPFGGWVYWTRVPL